MSSLRSRVTAAACAGALAVPLLAQGTNAGADVRTGPGLHYQRTLSKSLIGPLQLAERHHAIYLTDGFQSILRKAGGPTLVHGPDPNKGGDVSGVAINTGNGDIAFGSSNGAHTYTYLTVLRNGQVIRRTNLARYERRNNPDHNTVYGIPDPAANRCAADAISQKFHTPARYLGQVDSHPYAVAYLGDGSYAVADAGGNDIVKVSAAGYATRIAVLPRQAFTVTKAFAQAQSLPDCAVGVTYYTESVPTDVEYGPGGSLLVTTLPGGPDPGAGVGPRGSVYRINPDTHQVSLVATGFAGPTNLAVNVHGQIYVAELFGGTISTIKDGKPLAVYHATAPVGLEAGNGKVYLTTAPPVLGIHANGKLIVLAPDTN